MGPICDRTKENLVSTDNGIIMARHRLLRAAKAQADKGTVPPGVDPEHQQGALGLDRAGARSGVQGSRQGGAHLQARRGADHGLTHSCRRVG